MSRATRPPGTNRVLRTTGKIVALPDALVRAERCWADGDLDAALAELKSKEAAALPAARRAIAKLLHVRVALDAAVDDDPSTQAPASKALDALDGKNAAERAFVAGMQVALGAMAGKLRVATTAAAALPTTPRTAPLGTRALWTAVVAASTKPEPDRCAAAVAAITADDRAEPRYLAARALGAARHGHGGGDAIDVAHRDALLLAIEALERDLGPGHPRVAWLVNDLVHTPGAPDDALSSWLRRCGRGLAADDARWITVHHAAAISTSGAARLEHLGEALRRARGRASTSTERLRTLLGVIRYESRLAGNTTLAVEVARELEALARGESAGKFSEPWIDALDDLVEALRDLGAWDEAERAVREAVRVRALGAAAWHRDLDASLGDLHHRHARSLPAGARRALLTVAVEHLDRAAARLVAEKGEAAASYALARARLVREELDAAG